MADPLDDPVAQAESAIADARRAFAIDVDALLADLQAFEDSLAPYVNGGHREQVKAIRHLVFERFAKVSTLRSLADPVLVQLLREAFEFLTDPASTVDLRDWTKDVRKVLQP